MKHFYESIDGWFSYEDIYRAIVERAEDGDHTFEAVCADIAAFLPKMKKGGIMTGDDAWVGTGPRLAAEHMFGNDVDFPGIHFIHYVK